jgi:hypothetical protein
MFRGHIDEGPDLASLRRGRRDTGGPSSGALVF